MKKPNKKKPAKSIKKPAKESHFCPKCGCHWITHNGDGSCVED